MNVSPSRHCLVEVQQTEGRPEQQNSTVIMGNMNASPSEHCLVNYSKLRVNQSRQEPPTSCMKEVRGICAASRRLQQNEIVVPPIASGQEGAVSWKLLQPEGENCNSRRAMLCTLHSRRKCRQLQRRQLRHSSRNIAVWLLLLQRPLVDLLQHAGIAGQADDI